MQSKSVAQGLKTIYEAEIRVLDDELTDAEDRGGKKQDGSSVGSGGAGSI